MTSDRTLPRPTQHEAEFTERYRAVKARDKRFDGQFFTAVSSTGIYCRPSCPALTPKPENVTFFLTSAAAHAAGYRACKRCLPEASPGTPQWNLRQDLAARAMRLISEGIMNDGGVQALSDRLGYTSRHLHRTLINELGASPVALARAHRAQIARTLLISTDLPAAEVAFAAGFHSLRQFNHTMQEIFAATPLQIRRTSRKPATVDSRSAGESTAASFTDQAANRLHLHLALPTRQPYDAPGIFSFLAERALPGVETAELTEATLRYARTLQLPHGPAAVEVTATAGQDGWQLSMHCEVSSLADIPLLVGRIRRSFDLDADPVAVDSALSTDAVLAPLVAARPGIRLPGALDAQEYLTRAVVGQQISVRAARTHLSRLVQLLGTPYASSIAGLTLLFPTPQQLLDGIPEPAAEQGPSDPERPLRLPARSVRTVRGLASAAVNGDLTLHIGTDPETLRAQLCAMPGIGEWTASYLLLRVLSPPDIWMTGDVALVAGARRLGLISTSTPTTTAHRLLRAHARRWSPWRSYAAMHLWSAAAVPDHHHRSERSST